MTALSRMHQSCCEHPPPLPPPTSPGASVIFHMVSSRRAVSSPACFASSSRSCISGTCAPPTDPDTAARTHSRKTGRTGATGAVHRQCQGHHHMVTRHAILSVVVVVPVMSAAITGRESIPSPPPPPPPFYPMIQNGYKTLDETQSYLFSFLFN